MDDEVAVMAKATDDELSRRGARMQAALGLRAPNGDGAVGTDQKMGNESAFRCI